MSAPTPIYSIEPVTSSDLPTLADMVHANKLRLVINRVLFKDWPNPAAQKPLYKGAVEGGFNDPSVEDMKMVDSSGEIVGYCVLSRKGPAEKNEKTDGEGNSQDKKENPSMPEGLNPEVAGAVGKAVTEINKEIEGIDRFELTYLCVVPTCRRKGIGSQLVQRCLERAKMEGIPIVSCSEPAAYDFFIKLGFRDSKQVNIDLSQWAPKYSGFGVFRLAGIIWSPQN